MGSLSTFRTWVVEEVNGGKLRGRKEETACSEKKKEKKEWKRDKEKSRTS